MDDLPLGFGMALAQNPKAMEVFCSLQKQKQLEIVDHTHQINSSQEMHEFVEHLSGNI